MAMAVYSDVGAFALNTLRNSAAVVALVVNGASGILDAGELSGKFLNAAEKSRQITPGALALALVVVDTGETGVTGNKTATASVFIYDRQRAYANIRQVREAVITALVKKPVVLDRGALVVGLRYAARSGFVQFENFDLDYERVDFAGDLAYTRSGDAYA